MSNTLFLRFRSAEGERADVRIQAWSSSAGGPAAVMSARVPAAGLRLIDLARNLGLARLPAADLVPVALLSGISCVPADWVPFIALFSL